uniref:Uncharacterized protein n=1 Tax=Sphaerodactylus townsendi TaxID=933632 RepID=A0ACB8F2X9_9SAUR
MEKALTYRSNSKDQDANCSTKICPSRHLVNSSQLPLSAATGIPVASTPTLAEAQVCSSGFVQTLPDSPAAATLPQRSSNRVLPISSTCLNDCGQVKLGLQYVENLHELWVFIESCRGLRLGGGKRGKPNPYVTGFLLPWDSRIRKTKFQWGTRDPAFRERLRFPVERARLKNKRVILSVWHQVTFEHDHLIGQVNIDLDKWNFNKERMDWYPLQPRRRVFGHL